MKQAGLSLIEVLIALAILSLILVAATAIIRQSTHRSIHLQQLSAAEYCLDNQLAEWQADTQANPATHGRCQTHPALHWQAHTQPCAQDDRWQQLTIQIMVAQRSILQGKLLIPRQAP